MDYLLEQFFDSWYKLFDLHGWWSALLVAVVFVVMLPVNYGFIKLFAVGGVTPEKERLRKLASSVSVFVLAGGAIALFTVFISKDELTFRLVYQGAIPCGVMAMLLRAVYKLVRDLGIRPVVKAILESNRLKQEIAKYITDPTAVQTVTDFLKEKLADVDTWDVHRRAKEETELSAELAQKLSDKVDKAHETAAALISYYFGRNPVKRSKTDIS